ncbi:MAG: PIG-L deacetylase family protein [Rudaea sp.]
MADNQAAISDVSIPERAVSKVDSNVEPKPPRCVLSIHAHPDDQEFTVAGTLAKWARSGVEVISVVITSGDSGSNEHTPPERTKEELLQMREIEQLAACEVLGIKETVFLRYPDGMLQPTLELRRELTRLIRRHKPDAVVCGDPTVRFYGNSYMNHPDHRVAADVACDAVFPSAGTRMIFPELLAEGLEPHDVSRLFIHGSEKPDVWIDISSTIETKVCALLKHATQLGPWDPHEMMYEWAKGEGKERGLDMAESFRLMILKEEKPEDEAKREQTEEYAEAVR